MSPALLALGVILVVAGVRNTQSALWALWQSEFLGDGSHPGFGAPAAAVGAAAAIGYIKPLRGASDALTVLIIGAIIAANLRVGNNPLQQLSAFVANPGKNTTDPLKLTEAK